MVHGFKKPHKNAVFRSPTEIWNILLTWLWWRVVDVSLLLYITQKCAIWAWKTWEFWRNFARQDMILHKIYFFPDKANHFILYHLYNIFQVQGYLYMCFTMKEVWFFTSTYTSIWSASVSIKFMSRWSIVLWLKKIGTRGMI